MVKKKKKAPCCRAQKVHYVTPKVFDQEEPLPTYCGSTRAKSVTIDPYEADCALCVHKLKADGLIKPRRKRA